MSLKVNSKTGLVPVFLLRAHNNNVAGDIAGFPPAEAAALIDQKLARAATKQDEQIQADQRQKSQDAIQAEAAQLSVLNSTRFFQPAETQHEDEADRLAAIAQSPAAAQRFVDGGNTGTRQQIDERAPLQTAPLVSAADLTPSPTVDVEDTAAMALTTATAGAASGKKTGGKSSDTPPVPPT